MCVFTVSSLPAGVCDPGVTRALRPSSVYKPVLTGRLPTRKNTQKSKFLLSQAFKWKKVMFLVIPELPSKTFGMLYKKLPDHFKHSTLNNEGDMLIHGLFNR